MSAGILAMLVGLFLVPLYLLWAGHHWRSRSSTMKGAFWGGVIGHTLAVIVALWAAMYKAVHWSADDTVRGLLGLWLMLLAGVGGMVIGALLGARGDQSK